MPVYSQINWQDDFVIRLNFKVGLTYGAKINIGSGLELGLYLSDNRQDVSGISLAISGINTDNGWHKLKNISGFHELQGFKLQMGYGEMRFGYGYNKPNRCIIRGLVTDLSFKAEQTIIPAFGYQGFFFDRRRWSWFDYHYHSIYASYDHQLKRFSP